MALQERKRQLANSISDPEAAHASRFTVDDLQPLFAPITAAAKKIAA
ncbi:MAG: hypothetical protein IPP74_07425 [Alphaproteobacteria bacterium]|nr:hypothetical protein [Alphaproteobacteria bacterium]